MPGKNKGQLHTALHMRTENIDIYPLVSILIRQVNRARRVKLDIYEYPEPVREIWTRVVISTQSITWPAPALNGAWKLVNRIIGEDFILGPNQNLYASVLSGEVPPEIIVATLLVEDNVNEGIYTDIGSGVDSPGPDRGPDPQKPLQAVTARTTRSVKKQ